jgi:serpin B
MRARPILGLLAVSLVLGACQGGATAPATPSSTEGVEDAGLLRADVARAPASAEDAIAAASAVNAFGIDLYPSLATGHANFVFSPSSIALALAMARAGARGDTATQMDGVMHDATADANASWLNALDRALAARSGQFVDDNGDAHELTLRIANAAFGQAGMGFEADFLEALAARFDAGLRVVDYANDPEAARRSINGWVDERTEQRILQLLPPGMISPDTRLTLVNAIYLKAPWHYPFDASQTAPADFHLADGSTIQVPMMTATASFPHASGDGWRAVELRYAGDELSMLVIVPDDLGAFEAELSAEALDEIVAGLGGEKVEVSLPKFAIETSATLNEPLAALGMRDAFDGAADFSGITREEALFISAVAHQANIDVDEKGTTAAAATAVVMESSGAAEPPIRVDRPFLFALRDVPTGAILFLGRVTDPSAES